MEKCLSETIAETLEADLASGRWKTGERLPSVDELRERFGAGEYAVRRAIRRLADSGAISVKKHVGAVVTAKPFWSWKGRVAFVAVGAMGSYFQQMLSIRFAQVFEPAGWQFVPVIIETAKDGSLDLEPLRLLCKPLQGLWLRRERRPAGVVCRGDAQEAVDADDFRGKPPYRAIRRLVLPHGEGPHV